MGVRTDSPTDKDKEVKKLTFEEWLDTVYPYSERPDRNHWALLLAREAWNAARENS